MKLSERQDLIRGVFTPSELVEIRDALSDRFTELSKLVKKERDHGRKESEESWAERRLALLEGGDLRPGIIAVFRKHDGTRDLFFDAEKPEEEEEGEELPPIDHICGSCGRSFPGGEGFAAHQVECGFAKLEAQTESADPDAAVAQMVQDLERVVDLADRDAAFDAILGWSEAQRAEALAWVESKCTDDGPDVAMPRHVAELLGLEEPTVKLLPPGPAADPDEVVEADYEIVDGDEDVVEQVARSKRIAPPYGWHPDYPGDPRLHDSYRWLLSCTPSDANFTAHCAEAPIAVVRAVLDDVGGTTGNKTRIRALEARVRALGGGKTIAAPPEPEIDTPRLVERAESVASGRGYRSGAPYGAPEFLHFQDFVRGFCAGYRGNTVRAPALPSKHWSTGYDAGIADRKKARSGDARARYPLSESTPAPEPTLEELGVDADEWSGFLEPADEPEAADLTVDELEQLELPLAEINTRGHNTLQRHGIRTFADYLAAGHKVFALRGVGLTTLEEVNAAFLRRGITPERGRELEQEIRDRREAAVAPEAERVADVDWAKVRRGLGQLQGAEVVS